MKTLRLTEPVERVSGKGCKAITAIRLAGAALILLVGAGGALGDMVPDPRQVRVRVGDADLSLTPEFFLECAVAALVLLAVALLLRAALRAALRWARGGELPEVAPGLAGGRKHGYRKHIVLGGFIVILVGLVSLAVQTVHGFLHFRLKTKMSEARSNLGAIRSTEVAYFAEWNVYVGNLRSTPPVDPRNPLRWRYWDPNTRFSILGFAPEGGVYCSYAIDGPDFPTGEEGFTVRAECDLDGDGKPSVFTVTNAGNYIVHSGDDH